MKILNFANRNFKEIIRDPLSVIFAVILPLFLLFIFQQFNIPNEVYNIENFTPGIIIFSFAFISMFTATLISKDRTTSLLTRLCASPMKSKDYILGYILSILPIVIVQNILFFALAVVLGLKFTVNVLLTILISLPISILFIGLGILIGCITTDKSSAGVSSIVVQLVAFTSGMYFDDEMLGGFFKVLCEILPFSHSVDVLKAVLNNSDENMFKPVLITLIYTVVMIVLAVILFNRRLNGDK